MVDGHASGIDTQDRLDRLRKWRAARKALRYTRSSGPEIVDECTCYTFLSAYCEVRERRAKITVCVPPSSQNGHVGTQCTLPPLTFGPDSVTVVYDHSQRLLIVKECS